MKKTNDNFYRKGEGEILGILVFVFIGLAIWGGIGFARAFLGGESEGIVKYGDCRQIITIQEDSWEKYFKQFACTYRKTKSGETMGGECVHTDNDSSLFSSSHTCATAYVYEKKQADVCTVAPNLYLGYDDMCYTTKQ